jgi:hypothetical protein
MKRLKALRLFNERRTFHSRAGATDQDATDEALEDLRAEYGADPDWSAILELIFKFLALLGLL